MTLHLRARCGERPRGVGRRSEAGQSVVELALAAPVLSLVLFALIEFGLILSDQVVLNHAAADGARVGARGDSLTQKGYAQAEANAALGSPGLVHCPPGTPQVVYDGAIPDYVHVTISCTYSPLTPLGSVATLIGGALNVTPTLTGSTSMRVQ